MIIWISYHETSEHSNKQTHDDHVVGKHFGFLMIFLLVNERENNMTWGISKHHDLFQEGDIESKCYL